MTHTFSSFIPVPRPLPARALVASLWLCVRGGGRAPCRGTLPGLPASSSVKARGPDGMFSKGSMSPQSHASEIRAKKGSGVVPI